MPHRLIAYIEKSLSLTEKESELILERFQPVMLKKKEHLLRAGEVCKFEGFITEGCVRTYYIDENGDEVTLSFAFEEWWVGDIASFNTHTPSCMYIQALENATVYQIDFESKEKLYAEIPALERLFRLLVQRSLTALQNRLIATVSKPAEERYHELISKYPQLPQRVAQRYIASYLGISPEFLSKIRARKTK